jgi:hypothetical protein
MGILMRTEQYDKLELVVKILIYYRNLAKTLTDKNLDLKSAEWLRTPRYYREPHENGDFKIVLKVNNLSRILRLNILFNAFYL